MQSSISVFPLCPEVALKKLGHPGKETAVVQDGEREDAGPGLVRGGVQTLDRPGSERTLDSRPPTLSARRLRDAPKSIQQLPPTPGHLTSRPPGSCPAHPGPSSGRAGRGPGFAGRAPAPRWKLTLAGGLFSVLRPAGGSRGRRALACFGHPGRTARRGGRRAAGSLALPQPPSRWRGGSLRLTRRRSSWENPGRGMEGVGGGSGGGVRGMCGGAGPPLPQRLLIG